MEIFTDNDGEVVFKKYSPVGGTVCMVQPETGAVPSEGDIKSAQVAAAFLGKQLEE